ncbi:hypothetical protein SUDANB99_02533 [Streptomyces sp. enrichment culture]
MSGTEHWTSTSMPYLTPRAQGQGDAWAEEAAAQGRRGTQRIVSAGEVAADDEPAALLGLTPGEPVVVRRRVIELDGEPVELTDTYYPAHIARGTPLAGTAKIRGARSPSSPDSASRAPASSRPSPPASPRKRNATSCDSAPHSRCCAWPVRPSTPGTAPSRPT